jgi:hypothetical protein
MKKILDLLTPVNVSVADPETKATEVKPAVLIGRTLEASPRYDVRLESGEYLSGIPDAFVERREAA